jgi:FtsP/CotA-like multicopper oxidase with cupredoxin domain
MKFSVYLLAVLAVLGGLFVLFRPGSPSPPANVKTERSEPSKSAAPSSVSATPEALAPAPAPPQIFDLVIRRGRLVSGPAVIQVHQGDEVTIHLTADASDELHLHGYDLHAQTRAGETTTLQFSATKTGRFGYELHHTQTELGALEVYPR